MSIPGRIASFSLVSFLCSCSGSHGISEVASVAGGDDDGDDGDFVDDDGASVSLDCGTTEAEEGINSSPSSLRRPSDDIRAKWTGLVNFPVPGAPFSTKQQFGPAVSNIIRRWGDPNSASDFSALRRDDCLHAAFEAFSKSKKDLYESSFFASSCAGASAHAVLHATAWIEEFLAFLQGSYAEDSSWQSWVSTASASLKAHVFSPLSDASKCMASLYGRSASKVRNGVVESAETAVKSFLKTVPPSNGYYFGNPTEQLNSAMNYAVMSASLSTKPSSFARRGLPKSRGAAKAPAAVSPSATSKASKPASGNGRGRSSRGGKSGQRK